MRLAGGVGAAPSSAVRSARRGLPVEVEVETLDAARRGADGRRRRHSALDNFTTDDIREAVERAAGRAKIEISGGVTLERIPELAATGADFVSVGALTHSAPAVDISFEIEPPDHRPLPGAPATSRGDARCRLGAGRPDVRWLAVDRVDQRCGVAPRCTRTQPKAQSSSPTRRPPGAADGARLVFAAGRRPVCSIIHSPRARGADDGRPRC